MKLAKQAQMPLSTYVKDVVFTEQAPKLNFQPQQNFNAQVQQATREEDDNVILLSDVLLANRVAESSSTNGATPMDVQAASTVDAQGDYQADSTTGTSHKLNLNFRGKEKVEININL